VNEQIARDLPVSVEIMSLPLALESGALAFFGEKYGDQVKVYSIGSFSKEVCGGPHVTHTGTLGHFKITKQESVGQGIRRVRAILE
jgi:alanyl-tRNA synthetase